MQWLPVGRRAGLAAAAIGLCLVTAAGPVCAVGSGFVTEPAFAAGPGFAAGPAFVTAPALDAELALAAGPALAVAPDPIGYSPAKDVVAVAPLAVSITFGQPLRSSGASLRVVAASGEDVGKGPISTAHRTLRRDLQIGAPGGDYTIRWTAVSAHGHKMSGVFSFTAARSNGAAQGGAGAPGQVAPSAVTSSSNGGATVPTDDATLTAPTTSAGSTTPAQASNGPAASTSSSSVFPNSGSSPVSSESVASMSPTATGSPTNAHATANRPTSVAQAGSARSGSSSDLKKHSLAKGFTAIPLAVAGLLVLSAALVARLKRRIHAS